MLNVTRRRPLGPGEKIVAGIVGLVVLAAAVVVVAFVTRDCDGGLQEVEGSCMGISAGDFSYDDQLDGLVKKIAEENKDVKDSEELQSIALTMPFSSDETSAMPSQLIKHGLAGAAVAQEAANDRKGDGPKYQLLLADMGKQMKDWRPVVGDLRTLARSEGPPLIGTAGLGSSTADSKEFITNLAGSKKREGNEIPSMGPVVTSSNMNAKTFFKNSPSNAQLVEGLHKWLKKHPSDGDKYLVYDNKPSDVYASDLYRKINKRFQEEYKLTLNKQAFSGLRGDSNGTALLFDEIDSRVCNSEADTVFYVGRDEDLPGFIDARAKGPCQNKPLRILKVGIGLPKDLTSKEAKMKKHKITLVNASTVDPEWQKTTTKKPDEFDTLKKHFDKVMGGGKKGGMSVQDGYVPMYYDSVSALTKASVQTYDALNKEEREKATPSIVRDNIYNALLNSDPKLLRSGKGCRGCIWGASGVYGFHNSPSPNLWPVCKAVYVREYPGPKGSSQSDDKNAESPVLYRTNDKFFSGNCPRDS